MQAFDDVLDRAVDAGRIPGAVLVVAHDGEVVHRSARGVFDQNPAVSLESDTILWLASLSKVVCAATLLQQVDAGRVRLTDPVSRFVPEFAQPASVRVLAPGSPPIIPTPPFAPPPDPAPVYDLVPAERELVLSDLLTHTSGLQSIFQFNADYRRPRPGDTLATHVQTLAALPRDFQPGAAWAYSNAAGFDVLARVVEVASGVGFDQAVRTLLDACGAADVGFGLARSPRSTGLDPRFGDDPVMLGGDTGYYSGAAGMWGSLEHYLRFVEMLRADGSGGSGRVLSPESARTLRVNHVGGLCPGLNGRGPRPGIGFGLAVAVVADAAAAGTPLANGTFGWDGVNTRRFWSNAEQNWSAAMFVPDGDVQLEVENALATAFGARDEDSDEGSAMKAAR